MRAWGVLSALLCLTAAGPARAQSPDSTADPYQADLARLVVGGGTDLLVARVVAVLDSGATIADPPRLTLQVEKSLRGKLWRGLLPARWDRTSYPIFRCGNESRAEQEAWDRYLQTPVRGPRIGERLLLAGVWRGEDSSWVTGEVALSPADEGRLLEDIRTLELRREAEAEAQARKVETDLVTDRYLRAEADLPALCRASTDVLLGTLTRDNKLHVVSRLWSRPQEAAAAHADSVLEFGERQTNAMQEIVFGPKDERVVRCRVRYAEQGLVPGIPAVSPPVLMMFLRRGPFDPGGEGVRTYWLADHDNGLLLADPATLRAVTRALPGALVSPQAPSPECGASLESFADIAPERLAEIRIKITCLRPGGYPGRVQTFLFGMGAKRDDILAFTPCALPGEMYWNDFTMRVYPIDVSAEAVKRAIQAIPGGGSPDSALAVVSVRDREHQFEATLDAARFLQFVGELEAILRPYTDALWRLNYLKYSYGPPLQPDPDWKLKGSF